ncbi:MAG: flippase-like domain-containing protein [Candidatus Eisenbacteria sp.]|nr:flippase-like domain-containing protein [Candidatus Eisenbacteria bacterium]
MTDERSDPNRKKIIGMLKLCVSAVLLLIVWRSAASGGDLVETLRGANPLLLVVAAATFAAGQAVAALRLHYILLRLRRRVGFPTVLRAHFIGIWFNQLLPTGFGGDIVKLLVLRRPGDTLRFTRAVLLGRAFGLTALLLAAILLVPFYGTVLTRTRPFHAIALVSLAGLAGLGIGVIVAGNRNLTGKLARPLKFIFLLLQDMRRFARGRPFVEQVVTSGLVVLSVVACFVILGWALGRPIGFATCLVIVPPIIVSMHLPLSYGGWGIREVGAVALLPFGGIPPDIAFLMSLLYGLVILVSGLAGLVLWHMPGSRRLTRGGNPVRDKPSTEDAA